MSSMSKSNPFAEAPFAQELRKAIRGERTEKIEEIVRAQKVKVVLGTPETPPPSDQMYKCPMGCFHPVESTIVEEEDQHALAFLEKASNELDRHEAKAILESAELSIRDLQAEEGQVEEMERVVIVGLPIITRLLMGQDVNFVNLGVILIPDSAIHNARASIQDVVGFSPKASLEEACGGYEDAAASEDTPKAAVLPESAIKPFPEMPNAVVAALGRPLQPGRSAKTRQGRLTPAAAKRAWAKEAARGRALDAFASVWYARGDKTTPVDKLVRLIRSKPEYKKLFKFGGTKMLLKQRQKTIDFVEDYRYDFEVLGYIITTEQQIPDEPPTVNGVREKQKPVITGWSIRKPFEL